MNSLSLMFRDSARTTKICALAFWALGLGWLLLGHGFTAFLRPSLWPLLATGFVMAVLLMLPSLLAKPKTKIVPPARRNANLMRFGVLLLPLACLAMAPHSVLNSYAFNKRSVLGSGDGGSSNNGMGVLPAGAKSSAKASASHAMTVYTLLQNPENFQGHVVDVDGAVYRDDTLPKGYFVLFRFLVRCCAADATPVGILVKDSSTQTYPDDQWVHVSGKVTSESVSGKERVVLSAPHITKMAEPDEPYLYP